MPTYAYDAVDNAGQRLAGRTVAASADAAARALVGRGLVVLDVAQAAEHGAEAGASTWFRLGRRREVLEVTRAMAALLPVGMPLTRSLAAAANVATSDVRAAVEAVRGRVERGESLAAALAEHRQLFPPLYVGLVRAGERSGALDGAFARLAVQLERQEELRGRLISASIYPLLLATAGSLAVMILLIFVIPKFAELLVGSGAELPTSTAALLAVGTGLRRFWPLVLLVPAGIAAGAAWVRGTAEGARAWATFLLTVPVIRTARKEALAARFARLTGVLLGGGSPLVPALDDVAASLADPVARDEAVRIRGAVREGRRLGDAVGESPIFPALLSQLIGIGEEAGRLRDFLDKAADIFEEKTQRSAQRIATLAEPVMIMVFGVVVAFVALSLLQAIYGINTASFQ